MKYEYFYLACYTALIIGCLFYCYGYQWPLKISRETWLSTPPDFRRIFEGKPQILRYSLFGTTWRTVTIQDKKEPCNGKPV
jgi:hypothetical protein